MICPKCKHQNRTESDFCTVCGSSLQASSQPPSSPPVTATTATPAYPLMRGPDLHPGHPEKTYAVGRNSFIATIVSFVFPAGGQIYNGDYKKAGMVWLSYIGCGIIAGTGVGAVPAFLASLVIWAWAIFDAYGVAKRQKAVW